MAQRPDQKNFQLELPAAELSRLAAKIWTDYKAAIGDHNRRMNRFVEYYRRWRAMTDEPAIGEEENSNFAVPVSRWHLIARLAKEMDALTGDDAEVVAVPVGPSDYRRVKKIGRYMTWRTFNSMKIFRPLVEFTLRKLQFGRSVAYSPWREDSFTVDGEEIIDYQGPGFTPLWPDDFIVPAEEVQSLHDFSFVIRRYRVRPDELLKGERLGRYQGIEANFKDIVNTSQRGLQREFEGEEVKLEADEAEGILYQRPLSAGENLMVLEWHGKWRMLKDGFDDADEYDFERREMDQTDLMVRYLWDMNMIVGVQRHEDLFPGMRQRRPFVESAFLPEGRYWSPGLIELICDAEDELRTNYNHATDGIDQSIHPPLAVRPGSGFDPEKQRNEPGKPIYTDNPESDAKQLQIRTDVALVQWKEQTTLAYLERLTGETDMSMGRQSDRPNAPRTARQTLALLEQGNVHTSLFTKILAEDMSDVLQHFWLLDYWFCPKQQFFRVSEEDADGLFAIKDGGAILTREERDGRYDFKLKFANSVWSREAEKERTLARYQLDLQNPLITQNARALWRITNDVHAALGDPNFSSVIPEPPEPDLPVDPKEEWTRLLEGEEIHVNPLDNDELHLMRHMRDIKEAEADPDRDDDAYKKLIVHYVQQIEQLQHKKMVQAMAEQAVGAIAKLGATGGLPPQILAAFQRYPGLGPPAGNPAAEPTSGIFPDHPEVMHEQ
jgi:hypothetical protein